MSWERISNLIGITLLLICFVFSLGRIFSLRLRERPDNPDGQITLRIAHPQLEGGVREAVDAIGKKYTELHPNVKILQIPVPERIYKNWRITQLVGENPPDLMAMGLAITVEQKARYFQPLGEMVNKPNPYNKGTPLEKKPLRETYFDGMESSFDPILVEYYGVGTTASTFRMFYNLNLLKEITGRTDIPKNYDEFLKLCEATKAFAKKNSRAVVPVGGSGHNAGIFMDFLFNTQTQKLLQEKINKTGLMSSLATPSVVANAYWQKEWSLDSPEVKSGLELVQNVVTQMMPGFEQLERDNAVFYFAQGGAVMIPAGTWDAVSLQTLSPFPLGVGPLPLPDNTHAIYGKYSYGFISEANSTAGFTLSIPRGSPHPELAADFLLFMASMDMNKLWTDVSKWPPAIIGVEPSPTAKAFAPREGGYPPGFAVNSSEAETKGLYQRNLYRLMGPGGSMENFVGALKAEYGETLAKDLKRLLRTNTDNLRRADAIEAAKAIQAEKDPADTPKLDLLIQATVSTERTRYQIQNALVNKP